MCSSDLEEDLRNDLLRRKEQTVADIAEVPAVVAEQAPALGTKPPEELAAEVKAAVATAAEVAATVDETVAVVTPPPATGE